MRALDQLCSIMQALKELYLRTMFTVCRHKQHLKLLFIVQSQGMKGHLLTILARAPVGIRGNYLLDVIQGRFGIFN